jgi:hypothetical protein
MQRAARDRLAVLRQGSRPASMRGRFGFNDRGSITNLTTAKEYAMDALYALIEAILKITTNHNETFVSDVEETEDV